MNMKWPNFNMIHPGRMSYEPELSATPPTRRADMYRFFFRVSYFMGLFPYIYCSSTDRHVLSKYGVIFSLLALITAPFIMLSTFTKSLLYTSHSVLEPCFFYGGTLLQLTIVISRVCKIKRSCHLVDQIHKVYLECEHGLPPFWYWQGVAILVISLIDFTLGVHAYHSIGKSSIEMFYQFGYTMVNIQFCIMCKILDFAFIELHKTLKHIVLNSTRIYFAKNKQDKDKFLHEKKQEILEIIKKFRRLKVLVSKLNSEYKHELLFLILIYINYMVLASNFVHRAFKQFQLRSFMYPFCKLSKFVFHISFLCFSCDALVKDAIAIPRMLLQFNLLLSEQNFLNMLHIFLHSLAVYKLEIKVMRIVKINKQLILLIIAYAAPFMVLYAEQISYSPKDASVNILFLLPPKDKISLW